MECLLFAARGATDFHIRGLYYASPGVVDFLSQGMNMDPQDFMGRLEGFAMSGVKGERSACACVPFLPLIQIPRRGELT
jgi:hypothetical protein